jgi:hypothetical protein
MLTHLTFRDCRSTVQPFILSRGIDVLGRLLGAAFVESESMVRKVVANRNRSATPFTTFLGSSCTVETTKP